jgi:hypothetical protein
MRDQALRVLDCFSIFSQAANRPGKVADGSGAVKTADRRMCVGIFAGVARVWGCGSAAALAVARARSNP